MDTPNMNQCASCGMQIKDPKQAVQIEGKTYCSTMCADRQQKKQ